MAIVINHPHRADPYCGSAHNATVSFQSRSPPTMHPTDPFFNQYSGPSVKVGHAAISATASRPSTFNKQSTENQIEPNDVQQRVKKPKKESQYRRLVKKPMENAPSRPVFTVHKVSQFPSTACVPSLDGVPEPSSIQRIHHDPTSNTFKQVNIPTNDSATLPFDIEHQRKIVADELLEKRTAYHEQMTKETEISPSDHHHMLRIMVITSRQWRQKTAFKPVVLDAPGVRMIRHRRNAAPVDVLDVSESPEAFRGVLEDIETIMTSAPKSPDGSTKDMYRQVVTNMHQLGLFRPATVLTDSYSS